MVSSQERVLCCPWAIQISLTRYKMGLQDERAVCESERPGVGSKGVLISSLRSGKAVVKRGRRGFR